MSDEESVNADMEKAMISDKVVLKLAERMAGILYPDYSVDEHLAKDILEEIVPVIALELEVAGYVKRENVQWQIDAERDATEARLENSYLKYLNHLVPKGSRVQYWFTNRGRNEGVRRVGYTDSEVNVLGTVPIVTVEGSMNAFALDHITVITGDDN